MNNKIDKKNLVSQYNYFPYPPVPIEDIKIDYIDKGKRPMGDPDFSWHLLWPEKKFQRKKIEILIAGCGTDQAAIQAMLNPHCNIVGVDISELSIKHEKKLKDKHKLDNLKLICDDFRNLQFDYKFDLIIASGVIHHLLEPLSALKYFHNILKDDGVIHLMVYGSKQSYALNEVKKIFRLLEYKQDKNSIKNASELIKNLNNQHPAKCFNQSRDLLYDSGIIDLLLHNHESFFDIDDLLVLFKKSNLIIKNFFNGELDSLTKYFLHDFNSINKIRKMHVEERLKYSQIFNWNDRMMNFVITKDKNIKQSLFYNNFDLKKFYTFQNRYIDYVINENDISINEKFSGLMYHYQYKKDFNLNWKEILTGKKRLEEQFNISNKDFHKNILNLFQILIENHHLDISFEPINNTKLNINI